MRIFRAQHLDFEHVILFPRGLQRDKRHDARAIRLARGELLAAIDDGRTAFSESRRLA
jgi:hypothetical protein